MASPDDPREVVLQAESAVSAVIFGTASFHGDRHVRVASGAEALSAAAAAAQEGKRAAAVLSPSELLGAIEGLHAVARARTPIVIHVLGSAPGVAPGHDGGSRPQTPGRDEIAPLLDAGAGVLVTWSAQESVDL